MGQKYISSPPVLKVGAWTTCGPWDDLMRPTKDIELHVQNTETEWIRPFLSWMHLFQSKFLFAHSQQSDIRVNFFHMLGITYKYDFGKHVRRKIGWEWFIKHIKREWVFLNGLTSIKRTSWVCRHTRIWTEWMRLQCRCQSPPQTHTYMYKEKSVKSHNFIHKYM